MTTNDLTAIMTKYKTTDKVYYDLLHRIVFGFSSKEFITILEKAESENKKIYLKIDHKKEAEKIGIHTDGTIYIEDLGIH